MNPYIKLIPISDSECSRTPNAADYMGVSSSTEKGLTCISWVESSLKHLDPGLFERPESCLRYPAMADNPMCSESLCRNPGGLADGSFCLTSEYPYMGFCTSVSMCDGKSRDKDGEIYS